MNDYHDHELDRNDLIAAARKLWGKETSCTKTEMRFGHKGSKSIRLDDLVWFDHEEGCGGGIQDLCRDAGINGYYQDPDKPARPRALPHKDGDNWEPRMIPPEPAPINMRIGDKVYTYYDVAGNPTHYVRRFEGPPRKFLPLTWGVLNGVLGWHSKAPKPPLPLYRIEFIRELDPELILLVEGEKAADAANDKIISEELPWLALSWYGGASRAKDADLTPLKGRKVAIWPDADIPGWRARDVLLERLPGASTIDSGGLAEGFDAANLGAGDSIKAFVEARLREPEKAPEPTRQDPAADTPPQSAKTQPESQAELPPDITLDDFYAYLPKHQYLYVPTQTLWPAATISSRLGKVNKTKAARWLDLHRPISQIIWTPGEPRIVRDKHLIEGGWIEKPGAIVFNQYREPPLLNGDPAQAGPWIDLVCKLYPRPEEHDHIIRTLAFKLQHPEIKINHAIVLGGATRIGKDTMLVPIRRALGAWNVREAKPIEIMGNFNPYMRSIVLIINESRDLGEVKKYHFYDHMKDIIATPPEVYPVNDKHEKTTHVLNVCLVVMTTNYRTDGLYLPPDDARHFPVWSDAVKEDYEPGFFKDHYRWLKHDGVAHVAAYLRSLDVADYDPGEHPPQTEMLREIIDASVPQEVGWIQDVMEETGWTPKVFIIDSLISRAQNHAELKEFLENKGNRKIIPHRLERCGYTKVRNPQHGEGRWRIAGKMQHVYGNHKLNINELLAEAAQLR